MSEKNQESFGPPKRPHFATTHWSVVLAAGRSSCAQQKQALETLCQSYWFPLYAFLRRRGYDAHQAEDYTQGFFADILEKHDLRAADPERGRFRSFLLATLKHFLSDERDRAQAQKRGGGRRLLSLDFREAESQYHLEPADRLSPERLFEKSWALTVLEKTMVSLRADSARKGKEDVFDHLKVYLTIEKDDIPYRDMAEKLKMSEGSVRIAVHRLRRQYRKLLRDEIAQTVATEDQIDEEIEQLFAALAP